MSRKILDNKVRKGHYGFMRKSAYPKSPKTLGQIIRKTRMDSKKSLLEVAEVAQMSEGYLSRIEADKQTPTLEMMDAIAKALHMKPSTYASFWAHKHFAENSPTFQNLMSSFRNL